MTAGTYCSREVVVARTDDTVREVVNLMRRHHVGDVIVIDNEPLPPVPRGILTDRDIVLETLAQDVDPDLVTVGDIMSQDIVTAPESTQINDVIRLMMTRGVRRIPVVDSKGGLVGILSSDDIIEVIAEEMQGLSGLLKRELEQEKTVRT